MIVRRVEMWEVVVPLDLEWASSPEFGGYDKPEAPRPIVRIEDEDGFEGWGEMGPGGLRDTIASALALLPGRSLTSFRLEMLDLWDGHETHWHYPLHPSPFGPDEANLQHWLRHPAQVAVEMALLDLISRRAGISFAQFFGGPWREWVPVDYWMGRTAPEHARRCVRRALDLGFTGIKLKTTLADPNVERLEAIAEAAGPEFHVTVDPNGRFYRFDDAWPVIRAMDGVGNMRILEDPFPRFHLQDSIRLKPRIDARLVVHVDSSEYIGQVIASEAAGGLNLDTHLTGLFGWRSQAAAAEKANLAVWHGSGLDLGIYTAAQLHLAASAPNCTLPGDQAGPWLRKKSLIRTPFVVKEGCIRLPEGPGLGVEVDRDELEDATINFESWSD